MPKTKTHSDRVVSALGKRPQTATQVATKLGFKTHQSVAKALGQAVQQGKAVRTPKGYQKAL
jgi:hypothetical protein